MEKGYIDFHLHSTNSDGERTVEEYILDAAQRTYAGDRNYGSQLFCTKRAEDFSGG